MDRHTHPERTGKHAPSKRRSSDEWLAIHVKQQLPRPVDLQGLNPEHGDTGSSFQAPQEEVRNAPQDVDERQRWDDYMDAYEDVLSETSRPWAPWYAIPADHKPSMRVIVAEIVRDTLKSLDIDYPEVPADKLEEMKTLRALIDEEGE